MDNVQILYNYFESKSDRFQESRCNVMEQVDAVAQSLEKLGVDFKITAIRDLRHLMDCIPEWQEKVYFNLVEEFLVCPRNACYVPILCQANGLGCTGNPTETLLLAGNKAATKAVLTAHQIPCPEGIVVSPGEELNLDCLSPGRYIVKPACCDASEGIGPESVVEFPSRQLSEQIRRIHQRFNQAAIVERFIPSREINVSVIEQHGKPRVLPLAEIDFSAFAPDQPKIVDYDAKWITDSFVYNNTPRIIPADLSAQTAEQIRTLALRSWQALGCQGYVRVDFRLDEQDRPWVMEVNPNPDLSPEDGFAAALKAADIAYEQFVLLMLQNADIHRQQYALSLRSGSSQ